MVLRSYMVDFIHLLAPHYSPRQLREVAGMTNQDDVNANLGDIALPVRGGCEQEAGASV
jgi:hypothetical protein